MTDTVGAVDVEVEPDSSGFARLLQREITRIERTTTAEIPVEPVLVKGFRSKLKALVKTEAALVDAEVALSPVLARGSKTQLKADLKALTAQVNGSSDLKLGIGLESGSVSELKREAKALAVRANDSATVGFGVKIASGQLGVVKKEAREFAAKANPVANVQFAPKLQPGAVGNMRAQAVTAGRQVEVPIGAKMAPGAVPKAKTEAGAQARAGKAVDVPLDADSPSLAAKIKTITRGLSHRFDVDVDLQADTTKLIASMSALSGAAGGGSALPAVIAGGLAVGAPAAASAGLFGAAAFKTANFNEALSNLQGTSSATAKEMALLNEQALELGASTAFSASEVVVAQTELIKAGVSIEDTYGGGVAGALGLAGAANLDLGRAAEITSNVLNAFGLKGEKATYAADVLAAGANKSATDVDSLALALSQSALGANSFGISMEETIGALSMFSQKGLDGSDAGTSFKTMLQRLVPQTDKQGKMAEQLGLKFFDAQGEFIGLAESAEVLRDKLGHMTPEMRASTMQAWFGTDAIRAANILYEEGPAGIEKWTGAVSDSGYAAELAKTKLDNLKGDIEQLGGEFETAALMAGSAAEPALRGAVQSMESLIAEVGPQLGGVVTPFANIIASIAEIGGGALSELLGPLGVFTESLSVGVDAAGPGLVALAGAAGELLVAFSPLLEVGGEIIGMLGEALAPALASLAQPAVVEAIGEVALALADILVSLLPIVPPLAQLIGLVVVLAAKLLTLKPVVAAIAGILTVLAVNALLPLGVVLGPIGIAIVAIGAAMLYAYKNIEPFRNVVQAVGRFFADTLWPAVQDVASVVGGALVDAWHKVEPVVKVVAGLLKRLGITYVTTAVKALAAVFRGDFAGAWEIVKNGLGQMGQIFSTLRQVLGQVLGVVGEWVIGTAVPWLLEKGGALLGAAVSWVAEYAPKAIAWLGEMLVTLGVWWGGTFLPWMWEKGGQLLGAAVGWAAEFAPKAIGWLFEGLVALGAWLLTTAVPWLVEKGAALAVAAVKWAADFAPKAIGFLLQALQALGEWFIGTAVPWMLEKGASLVVSLLQGLASLAGKLVSWALEAFIGLLTALPNIIYHVVAFFVALPGKLIEAARTFRDKLTEWAKAAWSWLVSNLPGMIAAVKTWFAELPGRLVDAASNLGNKLIEWARAAWNWMNRELPGMVTGIKDWFVALPGKIVSWIGNLGTLLKDAGGDLIGGLFDGIMSAGSFIGNLAAKIANGIIDWINNNVIDTVNRALVFTVGPVTIDAPDIPRLPRIRFHTGGVIPGQGEVPFLGLGGEGVFTQDQMKAMGVALNVAASVSDPKAIDSSGLMGSLGDVASDGAWLASQRLAEGLAGMNGAAAGNAYSATDEFRDGIMPMVGDAESATLAARTVFQNNMDAIAQSAQINSENAQHSSAVAAWMFGANMNLITNNAQSASAKAAWLFSANMNLITNNAQSASAVAAFMFAANMNLLAERAGQSSAEALFVFAANMNRFKEVVNSQLGGLSTPSWSGSPGGGVSYSGGARSSGGSSSGGGLGSMTVRFEDGSSGQFRVLADLNSRARHEDEPGWNWRHQGNRTASPAVARKFPNGLLGDFNQDGKLNEAEWRGFRARKFHTGGDVPGSGELVALLEGGEHVLTEDEKATIKRALGSARADASMLAQAATIAQNRGTTITAATGGAVTRAILEIVLTGDPRTTSKISRQELIKILKEALATTEGKKLVGEAVLAIG